MRSIRRRTFMVPSARINNGVDIVQALALLGEVGREIRNNK
jgi:hypothetical protein